MQQATFRGIPGQEARLRRTPQPLRGAAPAGGGLRTEINFALLAPAKALNFPREMWMANPIFCVADSRAHT